MALYMMVLHAIWITAVIQPCCSTLSWISCFSFAASSSWVCRSLIWAKSLIDYKRTHVVILICKKNKQTKYPKRSNMRKADCEEPGPQLPSASSSARSCPPGPPPDATAGRSFLSAVCWSVPPAEIRTEEERRHWCRSARVQYLSGDLSLYRNP